MNIAKRFWLIGAVYSLVVTASSVMGGERFHSCSELDKANFGRELFSTLKPRQLIAPQYPRRTELLSEGFVEMLLDVRASGTVATLCILKSVPEGVFEQAAFDAARRWEYAPGDIAKLSRERRRLKVRVEFQLVDEY